MSSMKQETKHRKKNTKYHNYDNCLKVSWDMKKGNVRKYMQDRVFNSSFVFGNSTYYVFMVMDGHSVDKSTSTVDYVKRKFFTQFKKKIQEKLDVRKAIDEVFQDVNKNTKKYTCGTTISLIIFIRDKTNPKRNQQFVANVGDSTIYGIEKVINDKTKSKCRQLSMNHNVCQPSELKRITEKSQLKIQSGYVVNNNGYRLGMTRAIGDHEFGEHVLAKPTIREFKKTHDIYILATDGIWDVMDIHQVYEVLMKKTNNGKDWENAAYLVNKYRNKHYKQHDNTAIMIIFT